MTIPPYIPGTVLAVTSLATFVIGVAGMVSPTEAASWTDRGMILALLATMFISNGILIRLLLKDRTKREDEFRTLLKTSTTVHEAVLTFLEEEKKFRDGIANQAIQNQLDAGQKKTRTSRFLPRDPEPPQ